MELVVLVLIALLLLANLAICAMIFFNARSTPDLSGHIESLAKNNERTERGVRDEISRNRDESAKGARDLREELLNSVGGLSNAFLARMADNTTLAKNQLDTFATRLDSLTQTNQQEFERMREMVERRLSALQTDNAQKLEQMRATVDEKLHATLEQRLGESFKLVSDRLEQVHKGLGEMQSLATGVGDLKKVLTNIKTRGNWGEVQLGNLLEQMLTPDQYAGNVQVNPATAERVDFGIKLPGKAMIDGERPVWLPIDAKFPQEDYQRLVDATERGDVVGIADSGAALEARVCAEARKIRDKYIQPPHTTDFAILFLPTEGLFAEVLRRPGLCEGIQRDHRVVLAGPTTLAALLSSLQMGFRTLVIEKRSGEVWQVLGAVKSEFSKFGAVLDKVQKKLQEASNTVDQVAVRSRAVEKRLRDVQQLPAEGETALLDVFGTEVRLTPEPTELLEG